MSSYKTLWLSLIDKYKYLLDAFPLEVDRIHNVDILIEVVNRYIRQYSFLLKSVIGYMDFFDVDDIMQDAWWGSAIVSSIRIGGVPSLRSQSNPIISFDKRRKQFHIRLPIRLESININAKYTASVIGIPLTGKIEGRMDKVDVDIHIEIDLIRRCSKLKGVDNLSLGKLTLTFRDPPCIDGILNTMINPMEYLDKENILIAIKDGLKIVIETIDKILKVLVKLGKLQSLLNDTQLEQRRFFNRWT
ncbi:hypothetical protein WA026_016993 [Henosepilachna vigintioctopunctata]|uniref:Uncharacterized protein n=1 Tax=Henosepilachna vigintioctopunctata TaxID=420089 RepID=A0AAW1U963_9CUCU